MTEHVVRVGESGREPFSVDIAPEAAGWAYSGLRVVELAAGGTVALDTADDELIVLPLSGSAVVSCDGEQFTLTGRASVFAGATDFVYAPRDSHVEITSAAGGRFALPAARADNRLTARYGPVEGVPIELRGAGVASRQVNNFCTPDTFEADRLIAVEVLTPGGNWSSYPPHKHDQETESESALEEIYYFEVTGGIGGLAYQRVYASSPELPIDVCTQVGSGDVVLIPHGYHGPSMAAPGYDLYYLNVMAGPGERVWRFSDDPAQAWIRDTWAATDVDPRLPFYAIGLTT